MHQHGPQHIGQGVHCQAQDTGHAYLLGCANSVPERRSAWPAPGGLKRLREGALESSRARTERQRFFLRGGTLAPERRASESAIATACFLLVTFFPEPPERSCPRLASCMTSPTFFEAALE